ncbi:MAG: cellulase family glycosylhydrolase [Spirochaetales bacterium]|nr:cellulase family glycosylhydrolase [Spirochaetales bacterium]
MKKILILSISFVLFLASCLSEFEPVGEFQVIADNQWSTEQANEWYSKKAWPVGCNYIPSNAINQLEMWQAETFDLAINDKELALAASLGFNVIRVYLHDIAWVTDAEGLKTRMDQFLALAQKHGIEVLFVIFDDCWNDDPEAGVQPEPIPSVHNSGWVQSPGKGMRKDMEYRKTLESYVKDILTAFKDDSRIFGWDLYNEPGNSGHTTESFSLLIDVFKWAREVRPSQPVTSGVWVRNSGWSKQMDDFVLNYSDVVSYHNYSDAKSMEEDVIFYKKYNRPVICTEYMARNTGSTFQNILPILKKYNVAAINWGLVDGKTNTKFAWGTPKNAKEPNPWFHDIFRADYTPYIQAEVDFIRNITNR